jgi:hypothetical protein
MRNNSFSRNFWLLPVMVIALILSSVLVSPVRADGDPTTPVPSADIVGTPGAPTQDAASLGNSSDSVIPVADTPTPQPGTVGALNSVGADKPTSQPETSLPIWCPSGVDPVPEKDGCTTEFDNVSLLMDYINTNNLGTDGKIWTSAPSQSDSITVPLDQSQADATQTVGNDGTGGTGGNSNGVNIIILDPKGNSLPLNSDAGTNALLNGQPVWCPDGTTPTDGTGACTTSSASLGLLVSMMVNSSNINGSIYIQTDAGQNVDNNSNGNPPTQNAPRDASVATPTQGLDATNVGQQNGSVGTPVDSALAAAGSTPNPVDGQVDNISSAADPILHDPIWCPTGVAPDPSNPLCTPSQPDLLTLVTYLSVPANEPTADGIIWIEKSPPNDSSSGPIVIDGATFTTWQNNSLTLQGGWIGTAGNASITGSTTFSKAISVINWQNNVAVNNIALQGVTGTGLNVQTTAGVTLDSVSSNNNSGAGINIAADGNINANNITTTGNSAYGIWLDNCEKVVGAGTWNCSAFGTGNVNVTGSNVFSQNGTLSTDRTHSGLIITSNGNVAVDNSFANANKYYGINITTVGSVSVANTTAGQAALGNRVGIRVNGNGTGQPVSLTNTTTDANTGTGMAIFSNGDINGDNISARNNGGNGAFLSNFTGSGGISIFGTSNVFDTNGSVSLLADSNNNINIQNVTVNNSITTNGMSVTTSAGIIVACSAFSNNLLYGFDASNFSTLQINGDSFSGNGTPPTGGDYTTVGPGVITIDPSCNPSVGNANGNGRKSSSTGGPSNPLPVNIVNLPAENAAHSVGLDCTAFGGTSLILPNGDRVTYLCPTVGDVDLLHIANDDSLLGGLQGKGAYISAMSTQLTEGGIEKSRTTGNLVISFVIPVDMVGFDVAIFYWDGSTWVDLSKAAFQDGRQIFNGGVKTVDGRFEAATNFPGVFAFVRK